MTIEEAAQSYGLKRFVASQDGNLAWLVRQIYASDDDQFLRILEVLNPRVNWIATPAGTEIMYIDKSMITTRLE